MDARTSEPSRRSGLRCPRAADRPRERSSAVRCHGEMRVRPLHQPATRSPSMRSRYGSRPRRHEVPRGRRRAESGRPAPRMSAIGSSARTSRQGPRPTGVPSVQILFGSFNDCVTAPHQGFTGCSPPPICPRPSSRFAPTTAAGLPSQVEVGSDGRYCRPIASSEAPYLGCGLGRALRRALRTGRARSQLSYLDCHSREGDLKPKVVWRAVGGRLKDYSAFLSALRSGKLDDKLDYAHEWSSSKELGL